MRALRSLHTPLTRALKNPLFLSRPWATCSTALKAALNVVEVEERVFDGPQDLTGWWEPSKRLIHTEGRTTGHLVIDRGLELLLPLARTGILMGCRLDARAHLIWMRYTVVGNPVTRCLRRSIPSE